jgi:hypothetical protein
LSLSLKFFFEFLNACHEFFDFSLELSDKTLLILKLGVESLDFGFLPM